MRPQRYLDLFWEDLLTAGVDTQRPSPEQVDCSVFVDRGPIAGHAPAPPLERAERCRSLGLVLVVAERDDSADRHEPFLTGTWLHPAAVFGENASTRADDEPRRLLSAVGAGHRAAETDRLRRTIGVEHQRLRDVPQDAVLALLAPHGAGGHDQRETG